MADGDALVRAPRLVAEVDSLPLEILSIPGEHAQPRIILMAAAASAPGMCAPT
jgi:hypothetical protein